MRAGIASVGIVSGVCRDYSRLLAVAALSQGASADWRSWPGTGKDRALIGHSARGREQPGYLSGDTGAREQRGGVGAGGDLGGPDAVGGSGGQTLASPVRAHVTGIPPTTATANRNCRGVVNLPLCDVTVLL